MTAGEHRNALPAGFRLESYRFERVLAAGGFGITYLARDVDLARAVAIKEFLPATLAMRGEGTRVVPIADADREDYDYGLDRFRREAEMLTVFNHPNIVRAYRYIKANGTGYLVMEYRRGSSLGEILARRGTLDPAELDDIFDPLLVGLDEVHRRGFLHLDIKPGNLYCCSDSTPMLIDFGAARHAIGRRTSTLHRVVSAGYSPPELYALDHPGSPAADIYAMGAVMYHAVAGTAPPPAPTRLGHDKYVPARRAAGRRYPPALLEAIDWSLACDETRRPESVEMWRKAFDGGGAPAGAGRRAGRGQSKRQADRLVRWLWIAVGALSALVLIGLAALLA
jgi:serine/threonine protein kinase